MNDKLFIPTKIKAGYQSRSDTYTKKLAYIIYYDEKGKLRKETSWEGWRDKTIPFDDFENKPHSGFVLNKDVQRSSEWFGSGRNMIRIYDDRGMEFEITCDNLMFILMSTDCLKRGLQGEFVYAWLGKELILLPTNCDEYLNSIKFTELKTKKIKANQLIPGCSYKTKNLEDLIYLGRFNYYTFEYVKGYSMKEEKFEKYHIFINSKNEFLPLKSLATLALQNNEIPVSNYAELMELFSKSKHASPIKELKAKKASLNLDELIKQNLNSHETITVFEKQYDDSYVQKHIGVECAYGRDYTQRTFKIFIIQNSVTVIFDKKLTVKSNPYNHDSTKYTKEDIEKMDLVDLFYVTENNGENSILKII